MKATKVNAGLAESNGRLILGIWRDSLHVTCGLTACTPGSAPGPTLGNEYGKTLPLPSDLLVCLHWKKSPVYGVFGQEPPHLASDRNRKRTWACFSPRNLPRKFRPDPSTFYLVIVVTNRQTNAGDYVIPRESFHGDIDETSWHLGSSILVLMLTAEVSWHIKSSAISNPTSHHPSEDTMALFH